MVDNNDVIYVADRGNSRIQTFDTEGNRKVVWNLPILGVFGRPGRMPGTLDSIHQLACPDEKDVVSREPVRKPAR